MFSVLLTSLGLTQEAFAGGVVDQADLSISKVDSPDPVVAGNFLTYTLTVSNAGPDDAQNVILTDTLPGGVVFFSTVGCAQDPNGVPTCTLGPILSGNSAIITITVVVNPQTLGVISNSVSVAAATQDPEGNNNAVSETTTVIAPRTAVGGEIIPLDYTMVLVAGTQTTAAWMIPVIVSAIGIGIVIARKF